MPHHWLARLAGIPIIWTRPNEYIPAAVDELGRIWVDPRMTSTEQRCALAHEIIHLERGHRGCQPRSVELDVREQAARNLILIDDLVAQARWAHTHDELAAELGVTRLVLEDRLRTLTIDERTQFEAVEPPHP